MHTETPAKKPKKAWQMWRALRSILSGGARQSPWSQFPFGVAGSEIKGSLPLPFCPDKAELESTCQEGEQKDVVWRQRCQEAGHTPLRVYAEEGRTAGPEAVGLSQVPQNKDNYACLLSIKFLFFPFPSNQRDFLNMEVMENWRWTWWYEAFVQKAIRIDHVFCREALCPSGDLYPRPTMHRHLLTEGWALGGCHRAWVLSLVPTWWPDTEWRQSTKHHRISPSMKVNRIHVWMSMLYLPRWCFRWTNVLIQPHDIHPSNGEPGKSSFSVLLLLL